MHSKKHSTHLERGLGAEAEYPRYSWVVRRPCYGSRGGIYSLSAYPVELAAVNRATIPSALNLRSSVFKHTTHRASATGYPHTAKRPSIGCYNKGRVLSQESTMPFTDFSELKAKVSFGQTVSILKLNFKQAGNQWRGPCPTCLKGGDRALVITEGKGYYCFAASAGGDQIALVSHIMNLSVKDAAAHLAHAAGIRTGTSTPSTSPRQTVPESEDGQETQKFQPLSYLQQEHPAIDAIGFSPEICSKAGIGYAPKGIMRGTVAVPIRDDLGNLLGYIGITEAKLPSNFTTNVVSFPKTA